MVSVQGDGGDRDGGDVGAGGLEDANQFAYEQIVPQREVLREDLHEREGHGDGAQQQVGDRQVHDEHVPGSSHGGLPHHGDDLERGDRRDLNCIGKKGILKKNNVINI